MSQRLCTRCDGPITEGTVLGDTHCYFDCVDYLKSVIRKKNEQLEKFEPQLLTFMEFMEKQAPNTLAAWQKSYKAYLRKAEL